MKKLFVTLSLLIALVGGMLPASGVAASPAAEQVPAPGGAAMASLPLAFVPNAGQSGETVRFLAHGGGASLFFLSDGVFLAAPRAPGLRLRFEGANPAPEVSGGERLPGIVNYFIGNDPARWRTNLPTYAAIVYREIYPGVDLRYEGRSGTLKSTYHLAPGADPTRIRYRYEGAAAVRLEGDDLWIGLPSGASLTERAPIAWQEIDGRRVPVAVRYTLGADGGIGFDLGPYNRAYPLTIDPALIYSTYLGGSGNDYGEGIALDSAGNIYITGYTWSTDFPTQNPYQGGSGGSADVFVSKLSADGGTLLYSTYLGGSGFDRGMAITVDSLGRAYLTGDTASSDFPTKNAIQPWYGGELVGGDAFAVQLSSDGSTLLFSTYLGGSYDDLGWDVAYHDNAMYVVGQTDSRNFPVNNAYQPSYGGDLKDAFFTRISVSGTYTWTYSTYLGGSNA
ncbi:MAG TPA: hypothetical protein ENK17_01540, partial [Anaerolineae bacterium]|nr:hypothetical protein [Anaerolineae bacterium]